MPTICVQLGPEVLKLVRDSHYNLCLARNVKVNGSERPGNVVCSAVRFQDLSPQSNVQWKDQYHVFKADKFKPGALVRILSESVNTVEGETITFDNQGNGHKDGNAQPGAPFKVVNDSEQPATFGVNHLDIISGVPTSFFVSDVVPSNTTSEFLPTQNFSIFWSLDLNANSMYDNRTISASSFGFNMTGCDEVILEYNNFKWSVKSRR